MLTQALLAGAEHGLNRVLRLDATALPRLSRLEGKVIRIDCQAPALGSTCCPVATAWSSPPTGPHRPTAPCAPPPRACCAWP